VILAGETEREWKWRLLRTDSGVAVVVNLIQVGASSERAALVEEEEERCQSLGISREAGERDSGGAGGVKRWEEGEKRWTRKESVRRRKGGRVRKKTGGECRDEAKTNRCRHRGGMAN